jgi:parvulin-like peptidyl-prolyl isomerase
MTLKINIVILVLVALMLPHCSKNENSDKVVAQIGDDVITWDQFYENFMLYPVFKNNSTMAIARQSHLRYMIEEKILARSARSDTLMQNTEIQIRLNYIYNRELLKALYTTDVLDQIILSDDDIWEEYKRHNIHLKLRHLFATTRQQVEEYQRRLDSGEDFYALARECFLDSTLAASGGDLGFVRLTELDPLLVDSVYNQRIGTYSTPLRSAHGFHIIQIDDIKRLIFLTQEEFTAKKSDYESTLKNRRAMMRSRQYLAQALEGKAVTIKQGVLNRLLQITRRHVHAREPNPIMFVPEVTDGELRTIAMDANTIAAQVLVEFSGGDWTVSEFIARLKQMPPLQRPGITQKEVMIKHIVDMVRDFLLLQVAEEKGINQRPDFAQRLVYEQDLFLSQEFKKRIQMVVYKEKNQQLWQQRRQAWQYLKDIIPVAIDSSNLYQDLTPRQKEIKIPRIQTVIKEKYVW